MRVTGLYKDGTHECAVGGNMVQGGSVNAKERRDRRGRPQPQHETCSRQITLEPSTTLARRGTIPLHEFTYDFEGNVIKCNVESIKNAYGIRVEK